MSSPEQAYFLDNIFKRPIGGRSESCLGSAHILNVKPLKCDDILDMRCERKVKSRTTQNV